jgi:tetratricopeptide (TPR) repeat protein|tara:strand:+ start:375 stop:1844 length:1470 start_codon:yes stop_codon:yes gene_type:complete
MYSEEDHIKKASTLIEKRNYKEAKLILLELIKKAKNSKINLGVYYLLFLSFDGLNEIKGAKKYLEKCLKINTKNHLVLNNLANIYLKEGNMYKAEKFYLKSLENKNDYLIAIINIAIFYQDTGRLDEAKKFYLKAIDMSPKAISIYFNLSRIDKNFISEEKIKYLADLMKKEKIKSIDMGYGFFLLAEYERKKNFFIKEIDYLQKAHQYVFNENLNKNNQTLNYWQNTISVKYDKLSFINENKRSELINFNPIFIIGLPRSGSTMVEAILSAGDSIVKNLGETSIINGAVVSTHNELKKKENNRIDLDLINNKVLKLMSDRNFLSKKSKIFTEKSLENFFYIEVILKIFPKAKFINTFRNVEDNIFAIFQQALTKLSWTHSIENILKYVDNYLKIIKYFVEKYPDQILPLDLEELTNKPEETSKKLYSFCNLKWNERVLDPNSRKDLLISTASNIQIRSSIQKYNHEKYRPYKEFLKKFSHEYTWINKD